MIDECFECCHGIGTVTQNKILSAGYKSWDSILGLKSRPKDGFPLSQKQLSSIQSELQKLQFALDNKNIKELIEQLPTKEHWRILSSYLAEASYFDIETTGLSPHDSVITVVSCLHKGKIHTFVRGENMDDFLDLLQEVTLMVSFNGNSFDVPRIMDGFHIPEFPCPHIDLRWITYHFGHKGGLKKIEQDLGFGRDSELKGLSGDDAVWLWQKWKQGCEKSIKLLIRYCEEDVLALKKISEKVLKDVN